MFWSDAIQFVPEQRLKLWREQTKALDWDHRMCLHTRSSHEAKCFGCGMCPPGENKKVINRDLVQPSINHVLNKISGRAPRSITRIVVEKNAEFDIFSNTSLSHVISSMFMREDESLVEKYYKTERNSTSWASDNGQKDWFGGKFIYDILWADHVFADELMKLVPAINEKATAYRITDILDVTEEIKVNVSLYNSYLCVMDNASLSQISDKLSSFNWEIKVLKKSGKSASETIRVYAPEIKDNILFVQHKNQVVCYLTASVKYNPYQVLSSIAGKSYDWMLKNVNVKVTDTGKFVDSTCDCGKQQIYSYIYNRTSKYCPTCLGKRLLYKITQKG